MSNNSSNKRNKRKQNKQKKGVVHQKQKTNTVTSAQVPIEQKTSLLSKSWKIIAGLCLIATTIAVYRPIEELFLTSKEEYDKENFEEGDLKPATLNPLTSEDRLYSFSERSPIFLTSPINDPFPRIKGLLVSGISGGLWLTIGQSLVVLDSSLLIEGMPIELSSSKNCVSSNIYLQLKDNRIYISAEFKDLQKEEFISIIEYNHWRL